jgi:transglutaminase-like putative cysteine protease
MKLRVVLACLCISLLFISRSNSQPKGVSIAKKSGWVEPIDYVTDAKPDDRHSASFYHLLSDEQENTNEQEVFGHYAYIILTSEGIQDMSDLSFEFEPSYQQLILHEVKVLRNGATINHLKKDIQVIQREQGLESNLYDGTKTAIVNLKDVRVGDIVEYSYTIKGYNPVHSGHISRTFDNDSYQSIEKSFKRITLPADHKIILKTLGEGVEQPEIKTKGSMVDYSWTKTKVIAKEYDYQAPSSYNQNRLVMMSDYESWQDVRAWAKELFTLKAGEQEKIEKEIAPQFTSASDADYALKVIRFVQDEVRYLGFETGINTHKPYPPAQIYEQRFGDCKDKSLLLVTLLRAKKIEAYPVLVNTSLKNEIDERLPAGNIFDHCVVQLILNGDNIYVDPTMSNQGGKLGKHHFPDYRRGLIIDESNDGLAELPKPQTPTTSEIHTIDMLTIGGEAMMTVRTLYSGADADYQRSSFAQSTLEATQKSYKEYYSNLYPDIVVWDELKVTDDRNENSFIVEEKYKIPTMWKPVPDKEDMIYATIQPLPFVSYFDVPKKIQHRTEPYNLAYPVDLYHTIHVNLPEDFDISPADVIIENDLYQYEYEVKGSARDFTMLTHYKTKKESVPVNQLAQFIADHSQMYRNLVFELTYNRSVMAASKNTLPGVLTTIAAIVAAALLCLFLYHRYDPDPPRYMVTGLPIGGWLVLIAIGLIVGTLRLVYELMTTDVMLGVNWMSFLAAKQYGPFAFGFVEHLYYSLKVFGLILITVLFFKRRSSFPRLMTIHLALQVIIVGIRTFLNRSLSDDPGLTSFDTLVQVSIAAAIWIPYLNISQRVKDTFVIRAPDHNIDDDDRTEEQANVHAEQTAETESTNYQVN